MQLMHEPLEHLAASRVRGHVLRAGQVAFFYKWRWLIRNQKERHNRGLVRGQGSASMSEDAAWYMAQKYAAGPAEPCCMAHAQRMSSALPPEARGKGAAEGGRMSSGGGGTCCVR